MKVLLEYTIWNKVKLLSDIASGILSSTTPDQCDLLFLLDNPVDGTDERLEELADTRLRKYSVNILSYPKEMFKFPLQNEAMKYAKESDYDLLICPQDDQVLCSQKTVVDIIRLAHDTPNLGLIGCRDGFDFGYRNMLSSPWSVAGPHGHTILKEGEFDVRTLLNDGPLAYTRNLIETVGYHDVTSYGRYYIEDDYAAKCCYEHKLTNIILGTNLMHLNSTPLASFPSQQANMKDTAIRDKTIFDSRWMNKV